MSDTKAQFKFKLYVSGPGGSFTIENNAGQTVDGAKLSTIIQEFAANTSARIEWHERAAVEIAAAKAAKEQKRAERQAAREQKAAGRWSKDQTKGGEG